MATWPSTLPQRPDYSNFKEQIGNKVIRSSNDIGPAKQRRLFTAAKDKSPVRWTMTTTQVETFQTFHSDSLSDGALSFDWPHPRTGATVKARFIPLSPDTAYEISPANRGAQDYEITAKLELL